MMKWNIALELSVKQGFLVEEILKRRVVGDCIEMVMEERDGLEDAGVGWKRGNDPPPW